MESYTYSEIVKFVNESKEPVNAPQVQRKLYLGWNRTVQNLIKAYKNGDIKLEQLQESTQRTVTSP